MLVEEQIVITKDTTAVWKAITDIGNAATIISDIVNIEILHEPEHGLVGLKWRETRMYFGKPSAIDKWITDAEENKYYSTRAEMDGFVFITTMTISEHGNTVVLRSSHETKSIGLMAKIKSIPVFFFKGMLRKAILKDLHDIKSAVEHN